MKPHLCPKCLGEKTVPVVGTIANGPFTRSCPTCSGAGVLWGCDDPPPFQANPWEQIPPHIGPCDPNLPPESPVKIICRPGYDVVPMNT